MQKQIILHSKEIKFNVLQVIDREHGPTNEQIVAVNATDIVLSPELATEFRNYITLTYPNVHIIYYRTISEQDQPRRYSPVMEDGQTINVRPEDLKKYELTLEHLAA